MTAPFPTRVHRAILLLFALSLLPLAGAPRAASARQAAQAGSELSTRDGLSLSVGADGAVARMRIGDRELPSNGADGGFSVRMVGGTPNLLPNPSFEADRDGDGVPTGWEYTRGRTTPRLDSRAAHSGNRSMRISNPSKVTSAAFSTSVAVESGNFYTLSVWMKTEDVLPNVGPLDPAPAALRVDQFTSDGKAAGTTFANGYTGTSDWSRQSVGILAGDGVTSVRVRGLLRSGSGTVWFDDLYMGRLLQNTDAPVGGEVSEQAGGKLRQRAELPDQGLAFDATYTPAANHIRVDGVVTSTSESDKGFRLTYTLPLNAAGWRWGDYARRSRPIEGGAYSYRAAHTLQTTSRYPFGAVFDESSTLALGMPLDTPRINRIAYTSRGLSITFDLGVSRAARKLGPRASFSFVIYTADPDWRFRAVIKKYYDIFPRSFARRTDPEREGIWFVHAPIERLRENYAVLGLGLNQVALGADTRGGWTAGGAPYIPWDNERGIYGTAYNHHWAKYQGWPDPSRRPSYGEVHARLHADMESDPSGPREARRKQEAVAAHASSMQDQNGRLVYELRRRHMTYYENADINPSRADSWAGLMWRYQVQRAVDIARAAGGRLDGLTVDSTSGMRRWGATNDYSREHWAEASLPLTFSYDSGRVAQLGALTMYPHLKNVSGWLHERGMILGSNYNAAETTGAGYFGTDLIDYFAFEGSMRGRSFPEVDVTPDSYAMMKRTVAYQRPVSNLDQYVGSGRINQREAEGRMQQNLFYGIFIGARILPRATPVTGSGPRFVPKTRWELYAKYTPLFKTLAAAGWEPVTNARSDNREVWVERFGAVSEGDLHLTVYNDSRAAQRATITVDLDEDGLRSVSALRARELVRGGPVSITLSSSGTEATITLTLPARSARMIELARPWDAGRRITTFR